MIIILLYIARKVLNGRVLELKAMLPGNDDIIHVCGDDKLHCSCVVTGSRLRWNNSPELTFNSWDEPHTHVLFDDKYWAVLLKKRTISDHVWEFTSELHTSVPASNLSSTNVKFTCGSNDSDVSSNCKYCWYVTMHACILFSCMVA